MRKRIQCSPPTSQISPPTFIFRESPELSWVFYHLMQILCCNQVHEHHDWWFEKYFTIKLAGSFCTEAKLLPNMHWYILEWQSTSSSNVWKQHPNSKVHGAHMGPTWVLSAPDGPHVGPMNLAIRAVHFYFYQVTCWPSLTLVPLVHKKLR